MSRAVRNISGAAGLLLLGLAACKATKEPEPAPPVAALKPPPAPVIAAPPPEEEPPAFCTVLAGILATADQGFARYRTEPLEPEVWQASAVVPGTASCTIEGDAWPRARYECNGFAYRSDGRKRAARQFDALAAEIDQCLASPVWFPRSWQRGETFSFALGERQQSWIDQSTLPPTAIVLQVQEDLVSHGYHVKLKLQTVR